MTTTAPGEGRVPTAQNFRELSHILGHAEGAIDRTIGNLQKIREEKGPALTAEQAWHLHNFADILRTDVGQLMEHADKLDDLANAGFEGWGLGLGAAASLGD
jgi:hypothetical protein